LKSEMRADAPPGAQSEPGASRPAGAVDHETAASDGGLDGRLLQQQHETDPRCLAAVSGVWSPALRSPPSPLRATARPWAQGQRRVHCPALPHSPPWNCTAK
jgi:hypothetical protein